MYVLTSVGKNYIAGICVPDALSPCSVRALAQHPYVSKCAICMYVCTFGKICPSVTYTSYVQHTRRTHRLDVLQLNGKDGGLAVSNRLLQNEDDEGS